jgi:hypothetical protein
MGSRPRGVDAPRDATASDSQDSGPVPWDEDQNGARLRPSSLERSSLGCRVAQNHLHRRAGTRSSSGKDPTKRWAAAIGARAYGPTFRASRDSCGSKPTNSLGPFAGSWIASAAFWVSLDAIGQSTWSEGTNADFVPVAKRTSASDFHSAQNIGEAQVLDHVASDDKKLADFIRDQVKKYEADVFEDIYFFVIDENGDAE